MTQATEMTKIREVQPGFIPETGEPVFREGDKPLKFVSLSSVPSIDVRKGQRDPSYLEDKVTLPNSNVIQINEPFRLFPKGYFGKENPYQPPQEELKDAYVILQGNNRFELVNRFCARNAQMWKDVNGNQAEYDKIAYYINPVNFILLSKEQADDPEYVIWLQTSNNDGVKPHSPSQKRTAALQFLAYLKEKHPNEKIKNLSKKVAAVFQVSESRLLQWGAMSAWSDPDPAKGEGENGAYLISLIEDDEVLSLDTGINLYNAYRKFKAQIGISLQKFIEMCFDQALDLAKTKKRKDSDPLIIRIVDSIWKAVLKTFGIDMDATPGTPEAGTPEAGTGEAGTGDSSPSTSEPEKTLEELKAQIASVPVTDLLIQIETVYTRLSQGVIVESPDGEKVIRSVEFANMDGSVDSYSEKVVHQFLKLALRLNDVSKIETDSAITARKEQEKAEAALLKAQKEAEETAKAQQQDANQPVAV